MSLVPATYPTGAAAVVPNPLAPLLWLVEALWQYKWLVMMVVAVGIVAAATFAGRLPNVYTARGLVEIDPGQGSVIADRQASSSYVPPETITETEVQVIRSYAVLARVVDDLQLEHSAANPALRNASTGTTSRELARAGIVQSLQEGLTVQPTGRSYVVEVSFEGSEPRFAASVVNAVMREYLSLDIFEQRSLATEAIIQLSDRVRDLRRDLDEREQAVVEFRARSRIAEGAGTNILSEQLARLNEELIRAQAALANASATAGQRGVSDDALPQVVGSTLIQELRAQEATQQRAVSELETLYRPSHPRLIQARGALAALRDTIAAETSKIAASLGTTQQVEAARVSALEGQVELLRDRLAKQRDAEVELRRLEREVEASRRVYETFLNRFNEVQGVAGLERPDGRIVAAAAPPIEPSGPNRTLVVAGGGVLSGALAFALVVALALMDPRLRTQSDVARAVGLAPIAVVPPIPSRRRRLLGLGSRRRNTAFAEAITHLRAALVLGIGGGHGPTIVAMTAPEENVGHASLATALAQACAMAGDTTVLVDADFERPSTHLHLGGSNEFGMSDLALSGGEVDAALQTDSDTSLAFLAAGKAADPALYRSVAMGEVLDALFRRFDVVVLNLPPLAAQLDAQALCAEADVTAVAVRAGVTERSDLGEVVRMLRFAVPSKPLATVLIRG